MSENVSQPGPASATPTSEIRDVLCADQVATWLGVNRKTVYNSAARGKIPCQRLGKRLLFSREALGMWLAGHAFAAGEASP